MKYFRFPNMIGNMVLISKTSYFEQYLKSCLIVFMMNVPSALKNSHTITFKEILDQENYGKLIEYMIEKEMDALFRKSIDDIYDYLKERFHIDL
jgi:hypothetical protein